MPNIGISLKAHRDTAEGAFDVAELDLEHRTEHRPPVMYVEMIGGEITVSFALRLDHRNCGPCWSFKLDDALTMLDDWDREHAYELVHALHELAATVQRRTGC